MADYVRLKHEHGQVAFLPGNVFELSLDRQFDVVLMAEVNEHTAHPDQFLARAAALVKPGGHLVLTTPNGGYFLNRLPRFSDCPDPSRYESRQFGPNSDDHIFLLYPDEIEAMATAIGLVVKTLRLITNPLTNGHLKTAPLLSVLPKFLVRMLERFTQRLPHVVSSRIHTCSAALLQKPVSH